MPGLTTANSNIKNICLVGEWGFSRPGKHNKQRVWADTFITGTYYHDLGTFSMSRQWFAKETPDCMRVDTQIERQAEHLSLVHTNVWVTREEELREQRIGDDSESDGRKESLGSPANVWNIIKAAFDCV